MLIKLKVRASSKKDLVLKKAQDSYEVFVRAPAERGLANKAALGLLARALNHPAGRLRIVKGAHSPGKIVEAF